MPSLEFPGSARRCAIRILSSFAALAAFTCAHAQAPYPERPIRLLLPFAAGGTVDIMTRPIAARLHEQMGRPVIVDNRSSAGGVLAAELTAQAAPDGYTLFMASTSALFIAPAYFKKVNYDTVKDFAPISLIAQQPLIIVANTALPARSVKELVALAKARPGKLNYGTVGLGTSGSTLLRFSTERPIALILPALICASAAGIDENTICTSPPTVAMMDGAAP